MLYPNDTGNAKVPLGILYILALLKRGGHEVSLFDITWYGLKLEKNDYTIRANYLNFQSLDLTPYGVTFELATIEYVEQRLQDHIHTFNPDIIGISITEDTSRTGLSFAALCKRFRPEVPVVVGGVYCMTRPDKVIANSAVDIVCIGEGEVSILELMNRMAAGGGVSDIQNLWVKSSDGTVQKNEIGPPSDMETLPYLDLSLVDDRHLYSPFAGHVYKMSFVESQRGCPRYCTYCCNQIFLDTYAHFKKQYLRRKSVSRLINELVYLKEQYDLNFFQFTDDDFLLRPLEEIMDFSRLYKEKIGLPFWIQAEAWHATEEKVALIKDAGCISISMGIETGSEYILKEVMRRNTPRDLTIKAFGIMNRHGIRTSANVIIGVPEETRETVFETIELVRACKPCSINSNIFIPYDGTVLKKTSVEKGYLAADYYRGVDDSWRAVLDMPQMSKQEVENLARTFVLYCTLPKELWPDIKKVEKHPEQNADLEQKLTDQCWDIMFKRGINVDVPGIDYNQLLIKRQEVLKSRS
jgi:radical SAM superfamily enzyme YgiQ (UPF0313 family)